MPSPKLIAHAPVLLVRELLPAAAYFKDKLGFIDQNIYNEPPDFAIIRRDNLTLMLAQKPPNTNTLPHWQIVPQLWNVYFWVDDVEALYAEFQASGAIIDYELHTKPYGVKEFGIRDLDDHDIAFAQTL